MQKRKNMPEKTIGLAFNEIANSDLGMSFAKVMENTCVLKCAQRYLNLCQNLSEGVFLRGQKTIPHFLPEDLMGVEKGVSVLCAAYVQGRRNKDIDVCKDVEKQLHLLSSFYQKKVALAYFSACNILFDADDIADRPEALKQLQASRDELQKVHFNWPAVAQEENLTNFFEKVEMYGCQLGIEGLVQPEKKASNNAVFSYISPIVTVNSREI